MNKVLRFTAITVVLLALASVLPAASPSVQAFIEPGYAVGYYTSYYTYRINADGPDFINETRITMPPGVSGVFGITSGNTSASASLVGSEIVVSYGVSWNAFSNPNFDVIGFYALSDAGDKYYGCYFNATPDAVGVTATGFSQYVIIRTSTPTFTMTLTITQTPTAKDTVLGTYTITETFSVTPTITLSLTKSETPNQTATQTKTITQTRTGTPPTATVTPSVTKTSTRTSTPSRTATSTQSFTRTITPTRTATVTPTVTITNTITIKGIEVSVDDYSRYTAASGQPSAPLSRIGFTNIGGAAENVTAVNVTLKNSYGSLLAMSAVLSTLYLADKNGNTVASFAAPGASSLNMIFGSALPVPAQNIEYLYLYADMQATTFVASFAAGVAADTDVTTAVPVTARPPAAFPVYPQPLNLKRRTVSLESSYYDLMPPSVSTGQKNVYAFMLTLLNPGGSSYSAALLNYLTITVKDSLLNPIPADSAISRIEVRDADRVYFTSSLIPPGSSVLCALAEPVTIEATAIKNIYVVVDITAGGAGAAGTFGLSVDAGSDFKMSEYHYGLPVAAAAKTGFAFPQGSSSALVQNRATEMEVEYTDTAPTYASTGQTGVEAMKITLTNKGNTSTASAMVTRMTFYLNDQFNLNTAANQYMSSIKVTSQDGLTTYGQLAAPAGSKMTINFTSPVVVSSLAPVTVSVRFSAAGAYYPGIFKLNLNSADDVYAVDANIFENIPVTSLSSFPKRTSGTQMQQRAINASLVNFTPLLPPAVLKGQPDIPLFSFSAVNNNGVLSAGAELYRLSLNIKNQAGADISGGTALSGIFAVDQYGNTIVSAVPGLSGIVNLNISPGAAINQGATVSVTLYGNIPVTASAPDFMVSVRALTGISVRDANSKEECVKTSEPAMPWQSAGSVIYSSPATDVVVSGDGNIAPGMASKGTPDAKFMIFDFYNPGTIGTADLLITGITVTARDGFGTLIAPSSAISGAKIINKATLAVCGYVDLSANNTAALFFIPVNIAPMYAPYGTTVSAYIAVDIGVNPSAAEFMLRVQDEQEVSAGSSPAGTISKSPGPLTIFPVDSRVCTISSLALGFNAGHAAIMPVSGVQGQSGVRAMRVLFENVNSSPMAVTSIAVAMKDRDNVLINADTKTTMFYVLDEAGNTVASQAAPASGNIVLHPAGYIVAGNTTGYVTIAFDIAATAQGIFYLELETAASVGTLPVASINPISGEFFGNMKSGMIAVQVPDFALSAHAFPNPFNPDEEDAHMEYYIASDSKVTIRIFTIAGKPVAEIAAGVLKQKGLHSEDTWLAVNSAGKSVKSGVYIVIIEATGVTSGVTQKAVKKLVVLR